MPAPSRHRPCTVRGLAACGGLTALVACRAPHVRLRASPSTARVDAGVPPAPPPRALHASLLTGGFRICALDRRGDSAYEVVCHPVGREVRGGDVRRASRRWRSEELVYLAAPFRDLELEEEPVAVGVSRAGRVWLFDTSSREATPVPLPETGAHGRIIEAHVRSASSSFVARRSERGAPAGLDAMGAR